MLGTEWLRSQWLSGEGQACRGDGGVLNWPGGPGMWISVRWVLLYSPSFLGTQGSSSLEGAGACGCRCEVTFTQPHVDEGSWLGIRDGGWRPRDAQLVPSGPGVRGVIKC